MKIVLSSGNPHKISEIQMLLTALTGKKYEILSLKDIGFSGDIEENGNTFEENAYIKASVPASMGYIGIADDSGLCVDSLDGEPGIYSARYAGEPCHDGKNNAKLLSKMEGIPTEKRSAKFVCTIAAVAPNGDHILATGSCPGIILTKEQGSGGFGYDPLFYYEPLQKTFAQLTVEEKNSISHRAIAMQNFAPIFEKFEEKYHDQ
jgi:XTP/dITP diphosphohydrolase